MIIRSYRFGFNGQEKDNEVYGEGNSYTAEFWQYDPRLGRRWNVDPLTHRYVWISPYATYTNNPIIQIDVLGLGVDVGELTNKGCKTSEMSDDYKDLEADLEQKTGLDLYVKDGHMKYKKGFVQRDENGRRIGSSLARSQLKRIINSKTDIVLHNTSGPNETSINGIDVYLNFDDIQWQMETFKTSRLDPTTIGFALSFLHESYHTKAGGSVPDFTPESDPQGRYAQSSPYVYVTGDVELRINIMRRQLGPSFGQRMSYYAMEVLGDSNYGYVPFSKEAVKSLREYEKPVTDYYLVPANNVTTPAR